MRVLLLAVGRMKAGPERDLLARYIERTQAMARGLGFSAVEVREVDEGRSRSPLDRKRLEALALTAELPAGGRVAVLDERGQAMSSDDFAHDLGRARDAGRAAYALVIGGPDGFADDFRARADLSLAYGKATFPHQLARVLAAEQIYRAATILAGHPYHRA